MQIRLTITCPLLANKGLAQRGLRGALPLAVMFLAIGCLCLGLWWLGGRATPRAVPEWVPLGLTIAGGAVALMTRPRP